MVSSHASSSRTCPVCGAHNSELSIFCAECGSGLNSGPWQDDGQTQAFQPAATGGASSWTAPTNSGRHAIPGNHDAGGDADSTTHASETPRYPPSGTRYSSGSVVASWTPPNAERGARGLVLGILAWLLILAVFGIYLWSATLSSGLREDIRDLIPGLSAIVFDFIR